MGQEKCGRSVRGLVWRGSIPGEKVLVHGADQQWRSDALVHHRGHLEKNEKEESRCSQPEKVDVLTDCLLESACKFRNLQRYTCTAVILMYRESNAQLRDLLALRTRCYKILRSTRVT